MDNTQAMRQLVGHTVLWIGNECEHWTPQQFADAARFARSLGVDTISPKRADGSIKWYGSADNLKAERAAVLAAGCGYLPFLYAYGPRFGPQQVIDECAALAEMMAANDGAAMADMEAEWNGQITDAQLFCDKMRPVAGNLFVTTWGDPALQNWNDVAARLAPCVNCWIPQRYDDWLAAQPLPQEMTTVIPGIDLTQEFGPNNQTAIAHGAGGSVMLWEYAVAQQNPGLVKQIVAAVGGGVESSPAPAPAATPAPAPAPTRTYRVQPHDTLWSIAQRFYGNGADWQRIYQANMRVIGSNPDMIRIGATLVIP